MARVYISYNSRDAELAKSVSAGLKARGHKVNLDVDVLRPGVDWRSALGRALESSTAVVALITDNSFSSQYVFSEVGAARTLGKVLIPVVFGGLDFPLVVSDLLCIRASEDKVDAAVEEIHRAIGVSENRNVFIVHGHNEVAKWELKNLLDGLGLRPIILHEQDDLGKTIIEKFEYYAPQCVFAFVLLTPDDRTVTEDPIEAKWRARQNVIMELGWFIAKLGRQRVVILHQGELETPSDILGVLDLRFDRGVTEVSEKIRQRLKGVDLIT